MGGYIMKEERRESVEVELMGQKIRLRSANGEEYIKKYLNMSIKRSKRYKKPAVLPHL